MANAKKNEAPAQPATQFDFGDWETGGAKVDGWFSPPNDKDASIKGIVVDFIDSSRSDKLQSDSIVLELTEATDFVKDAVTKEIRKANVGENIAVPVWTQLEGVYERKCGHAIEITRGPKRAIGKGRSFYDCKYRASKTKIRDVEVRQPVAKSAGDEAPVQFETN